MANRSPGAAEISQSCVGSNWVVAGFRNDQVARGCPDVLLAEQLELQLIGILLAYHVWALSLPKEWLLLLTLQVFPQADMWRRMLYQRAHLVESDAATHLLLDLVNDALSRSWQVHLVPERLQRPAQKTLVALPQRLDPTTSVFVRLPLKVALLLGRGDVLECSVTQACSHVTRACRTNVSRRSCSLSKTFLMVCYLSPKHGNRWRKFKS